MKVNGCRRVFVVIVTIIATFLYVRGTTAQQRCLHAEVDISKLSCFFDDNFCGWKNARDDDFDWSREGSHATAESNIPRTGITARLESPWLCATGTNYISLQFGYYMGSDSNKCQLTFLIKTQTGTKTILTTRSHSGLLFKDLGPFYLACRSHPFKIVLEAKKLKTGQCGYTTKGIDIDDIVVGVEKSAPLFFCSCRIPQTTKTPSTTTTTSSRLLTTQNVITSTERPATTSTPVPSVLTTQDTTFTSDGGASELYTSTSITTGAGHSHESTGERDRHAGGEKTDLGGGTIAGIVVAVVVGVVAVIAVGVFLLMRRNNGDTPSKDAQNPTLYENNLSPTSVVANTESSENGDSNAVNTDSAYSGEYETNDDYQNTHPKPRTSSSTYYSLPAVLSAVSGPTAENHETLAAARPQSTGHYTQLSTKKRVRPVLRSEDNETLGTSPSSPYYLTLIADNQVQDAASTGTYEQVMARPPSEHYTALNTSTATAVTATAP